MVTLISMETFGGVRCYWLSMSNQNQALRWKCKRVDSYSTVAELAKVPTEHHNHYMVMVQKVEGPSFSKKALEK